MCLSSLDFYVLLYSRFDSAYINCVIRREKHKKLCFNVLCANRCIRRHYTKSDPGIELLEETPVIKEHLKKTFTLRQKFPKRNTSFVLYFPLSLGHSNNCFICYPW